MQPQNVIMFFYDGPSPPPGTFDDILAIPYYVIKNVATQSFLSLIKTYLGDPGTPSTRYVL